PRSPALHAPGRRRHRGHPDPAPAADRRRLRHQEPLRPLSRQARHEDVLARRAPQARRLRLGVTMTITEQPVTALPGGAGVRAPIPEGFIMPDFGDRMPGPGSPQTGTSAEGGTTAYTGPRKMAFICSKGNLDMAYPAFIMGNAALGEGIEVHIFFTFWGLDIINTKLNHKLKFTMAGNTAMHMNELGRLKPGWENKSMPQAMGNLPGMTKFATNMM